MIAGSIPKALSLLPEINFPLIIVLKSDNIMAMPGMQYPAYIACSDEEYKYIVHEALSSAPYQAILIITSIEGDSPKKSKT